MGSAYKLAYALLRPFADAAIDALVDALHQPRKTAAEREGAGDDLVPVAAARRLRDWLHQSNAPDPRPEYTPQDQQLDAGARGVDTTRRVNHGSDDGHPARLGDSVTGGNRPPGEG